MKKLPYFAVLIEDNSLIKYENFFELGTWKRIRHEILLAKRRKLDTDEIKQVLERECRYYFWSKAEWEIVVSPWLLGSQSEKIDVFDQLEANWDIFSEIALKDCGIKNG